MKHTMKKFGAALTTLHVQKNIMLMTLLGALATGRGHSATKTIDFESFDTFSSAITLDATGIDAGDGVKLKTAPGSGEIIIGKSGQIASDIALKNPIAGNIVQMNGINPCTFVEQYSTSNSPWLLPEELETQHGLVLDFGTNSNITVSNLQFDTQKLTSEFFAYVALYSTDNGESWTVFKNPIYSQQLNDSATAQHYNFDGTIAEVDQIRLISFSRKANDTGRAFAIDNISVTYLGPNNYIGLADGDICDSANWENSVLPTAASPGILATDAVFTSEYLTDYVLEITNEATLTRGRNGWAYLNGNSKITVDDGAFVMNPSPEGGTRVLRVEDNASIIINRNGSYQIPSRNTELSGAATLTLNGGSYTGNISISGSASFTFNGGTINSPIQATGYTGSETAIIIGDGTTGTDTLNLTSLSTPSDGSAVVNFLNESTHSVDVASHTDLTTATTFWQGLWDNDQLKYNSQTKSDLDGASFSSYFDIDSETFALSISSAITPAIGLEVVQDGTELNWTVDAEIGIKEYQVVDATTGELIEVVTAGKGAYSLTLPEGVDAKLVVVDNSGYTQTFVPADGNEVKVVYDLNKGWNLIALPGDNAGTTALKALTVGGFWGWNGTAYETTSTPAACQGIWVYAPKAVQTIVTAEKSDAEISLQPGWNLVGPKENTQVPEAAHTVYGWNETYEELLKGGTMIQGIGYWIFSL